MTDQKQLNSTDQWTSPQAYILAVICLLVGIAGGWFIRGSHSHPRCAGGANHAHGYGDWNGIAGIADGAANGRRSFG